MTREEMRERVARSICCVNGECYRPDKCHSWSFGGEADAAIAIIRGETLEEAAEAVEAFYGHGMTLEHAAAIRALKEKQ